MSNSIGVRVSVLTFVLTFLFYMFIMPPDVVSVLLLHVVQVLLPV